MLWFPACSALLYVAFINYINELLKQDFQFHLLLCVCVVVLLLGLKLASASVCIDFFQFDAVATTERTILFFLCFRYCYI